MAKLEHKRFFVSLKMGCALQVVVKTLSAKLHNYINKNIAQIDQVLHHVVM